MNAECQKEIAALKLLNRDWDAKSEDDRRGMHDTFMWTIDAAVKVGLVQFPTRSNAQITEEFRTTFGTVKIEWPAGVTKEQRSTLLREMADWNDAPVVQKHPD